MHATRSNASEFTSVPSNDPEPAYVLFKRTAMNPADVEDVSASTVEVTVLWGHTLLHVAHLDDTMGFTLVSELPETRSLAQALVPGVALGAACMLAGVSMGAQGNFALTAMGALSTVASCGGAVFTQYRNARLVDHAERFIVDPTILGRREAPVVLREGAATRFVLLPGAHGEIEIGGETRELDALVAADIARPSKALSGAYEVNIVPGGRYTMQLGELAIQVRLVAAGRPVARASQHDPTLRRSWVASACAVALALGMTHLAAQDGALFVRDDHEARLSELRAFVSRQREQLLDRPENLEREAAAVAAPPGAAPLRREMNQGRVAQDRHPGPRATGGRPQSTREMSAREAVANRGIFASLHTVMHAQDTTHGIHSPFLSMTDAATSPRNARGSLEGTDMGEIWGLEGLHSGVSANGYERGVNVGALSTQGRTRCTPGEECRYGSTQGNRLAVRGTHGPLVSPRPPVIEGVIAPETIRRVVVRNIGQVNQCYTQGLTLSPSAAGRVTVRFVIAPGGAVLMATVAQNDLGIASVGDCIASAVRRWQFSVPDTSGPITVTYPFMLQATDP